MSVQDQKMWTREQKLRFVQEYVKYKVLMVTGIKHETKTRKLMRNAALIQVSKAMNIPGFGPKEVYRKLRNMKSTYAQELKKIKNASARGDKYVSNLIWFKTLDREFQAFNNEECNCSSSKPERYNTHSEMDVKIEISNTFEPNEDYAIKHEICETFEESNYLEEEKLITIENENLKIPIFAQSNANRDDAVECTDKTCDSCEEISNDLLVMHNKNEFDIFGESIAAQLKNMPLSDALEAQMYIQNYLSNLRLQALRR